MNIASTRFSLGVCFAALLIFVGSQSLSAQFAIGNAFTYQGSLQDGGNPANGNFDFRFSLWDDPTAGNQTGPTIERKLGTTVAVANGLFNVTLDFGDQFNGDLRFLEIQVRAYDATDSLPYSTLSPRTPLTPTPYALHASDAGTVGGMAASSLNENPAPVALLEADNYNILIGSVISPSSPIVTFDLSNSYDSDGQALTYAFDPFGNSNTSLTFGAAATLQVAYTSAGTYLAEGWVRAGSQNNVDRVLINVRTGACMATAAFGALPNQLAETRLAEVNGHPAMVYTDQNAFKLFFVRALDENGFAWGTPVEITEDFSSGTQFFPSLTVVNGHPAVSYYRTDSDSLNYVRSSDPNGSSWLPTPSIALEGLYTSLAIVAGRPAISYRTATGELRYIRANDATGTTWAFSAGVGSGFTVPGETSLAVVNGNPAIAFYDAGDLKYARANSVDGTSWHPSGITTVDAGASGANVGRYASLAVINGRPAISFYDQTNQNLNYSRASDANGAVWGPRRIVEATGQVGLYTSMMAVNGLQAISYYDLTNGNLKYITGTEADGLAWNTPIIVDSTDNVGLYTSLAFINGFPAIGYVDATNGDVKFAR